MIHVRIEIPVVTSDAESILTRVIREVDELILALAKRHQIALRGVTENGRALTRFRRRGEDRASDLNLRGWYVGSNGRRCQKSLR